MTAPALARARFTHAPAPTFAPERDLSYKSEGAEIARVARLLGLELMPWQRLVADIGTEYRLDQDGDRVYKYKTVFVSVPRQSGKSTLMQPVRLHRILTRPGIDAFSTAQTGKAARERIMKMIERVETSPLAPLCKSLRSNGAEGLQVYANRSRLTRFSPVNGALHGETPHFVDFDEVWKYSEQLGDALLGGASPGMITLGNRAQIWMISTKGTALSTFMNRYVEAGEKGDDPSLAYFAWQLPEGLDPDDRESWWQFHPALGNTISEDDLATEMYAAGVSESERIRAYMNLITVVTDSIIPLEVWEDLARDPETIPELSECGIGIEVAPGNACAAVVAAWIDTDGSPVVRVLHQAPGTAWLEPYLMHLRDYYGVNEIAADDGGPVRRITDDIHPLTSDTDREPALTVQRLSMQERSTADLDLLAAARDERRLKHDGSKVLQAAIASAQLRTRNGIELIDRDKSLGPVPALIAASAALWHATHKHTDTHRIQLF
ncbi:hypothetical protein HMPREF3157_02140 [Dermabacter sp. HMSC06F07]|nr:hypothetical protein HMPREF3157_02140 [Dermabacter sp. HMSC06F07]